MIILILTNNFTTLFISAFDVLKLCITCMIYKNKFSKTFGIN